MSKTNLEELTILTNQKIDPELALKIEREAFVNEPHETKEGIEFLLQHGTVLALQDIKTGELKGVAESIRLHDLLNQNVSKLLPHSPLRMIIENDKQNMVLKAVMGDYPNHTNYHYAHGIAVSQKGLGYGTEMFAEEIKRLVGENDLMFGFVMTSPPNIPSIRMCLTNGAVIDKVKDMVYEPGKPYFRMVYGKKLKTNPSDLRKVRLEGNYLTEINVLLTQGYVGTRFEQPNSLVFQRRL